MPYIPLTLEELYQEYTQTRKIELTFEQFIALATFFPALLVLSTDGEVDDVEWNYVDNLTNSMCDAFKKDGLSLQEIKDLKRLFQREVHYLQENFDTWERKFTKSLKIYLAQHTDCRDSVLDNIYHSAAVSEGICEKEKVMIEYLLKELGMA
ncbi:MAG: hypothetical protein V4714_10000 [Bacteroidota bacterium]